MCGGCVAAQRADLRMMQGGTPASIKALPQQTQPDPLAVQEVPDSMRALQADASSYQTEVEGEGFTFRRFLTSGGKRVSHWHDVPLRGTRGFLNAVIEIPRKTRAKMEMTTTEELAPIKQDVKKNKLRDYAVDIEWNYGAFPQTWEQPDHAWSGLDGHRGDNDPLDLVDLSSISTPSGSVIEVKVVAVLAMIDEGEVDWKVIVINAEDPKAALVNDLEDCERQFPGQIERVREWFMWYKAIDGLPGDGPLGSNRIEGKEPNVFGFDGKALSRDKAIEVVEETHAAWKALSRGAVPANGLKL